MNKPVEDERTQRVLGASLGGEADPGLKDVLAARPELAAHLEDLGEATASLDGAARLARDVIADVDREAARIGGGAKDDPHHEAVARVLRDRAASVRATYGTQGRRRARRWRWFLLAASLVALAWLGVEAFDPWGGRVADDDSAPLMLGGGAEIELVTPRDGIDGLGEFRWTSSLSLPAGGYFEIRIYEGADPRADRQLYVSPALRETAWTLDEKESVGWSGTVCWEVVAFVPAQADPVAQSEASVIVLP